MKHWFFVLLFFVGVVQSQVVDKNDSGYIQVMGIGKTVDEAKQNGFKNAITMRVGSALLSENQVTNNKLLKEDVIDYSAGYIDSYKIIDTVVKPNHVLVIMQVVVRSSKIHERILNKGKDEKDLDGSKLASQYQTYLDERKAGDRFLNAVLKDYPGKSFKILQGAHEFKVNTNRNAVLVIPFDLRWSKPFLVSLHESMNLLSDGSYDAPSKIMVGHSRYSFNDFSKYDQLRNSLSSALHLRADMIDSSSRIIATRCYIIPPVFAGSPSHGMYRVYETEVIKSVIQIEVDPSLSNMLASVIRTDLSVVSTCSNL
jgi:hypothetical protein